MRKYALSMSMDRGWVHAAGCGGDEDWINAVGWCAAFASRPRRMNKGDRERRQETTERFRSTESPTPRRIETKMVFSTFQSRYSRREWGGVDGPLNVCKGR